MYSDNVERYAGMQKSKSWTFRFFMISINLLLLYLTIDSNFWLKFSQFVFVIFLSLLLINYVKSHKRKRKSFPINRSVADLIRISTKYFQINKKYVVVSVFGLIFATVVISQSILLSSSYQQNSFQQFIQNADNEVLSFDVNGMNDFSSYQQWKNDVEIEAKRLLVKYDFELEKIETNFEYSLILIAGEIVVQNDGSRYVSSSWISSRVWTKEKYDLLMQLPTFDKSLEFNPNDTIIIKNNWFNPEEEKIITNNSISILIGDSYKDSNDNSPYYNITKPITLLWKPTELDQNYVYDNNLWRATNDIFGSLLSNEQDQIDTFEKIRSIATNNSITIYNELRVKTNVYIVIPDVTETSLDELKSKLNKLSNEAQSWGYSPGFEEKQYHIRVYSPLARTIDDYKLSLGIFKIVLLFVTSPLVGLALFLVYFSLTLVEQRKSRLISILKIRGSSNEQIRTMLVSEVISGAIIAIIVGMVLSIPWTALSLRSSGILEFNNDQIPISIPSQWYWKMPLVGLILAIDLNVTSIINLSKTKVEEGEQSIEKKQPFWQRYYLDLILFIISTIYWISIRNLPFSSIDIFFFFVLFLGPFMLLFSLISIPLVVARYFSEIIGVFSDMVWKLQGGLFALATRNMRKNRFSASRLAALLLMGMMLSFVAVIVPSTFEDWGNERIQYNLGSDIYINGIDSTNKTQWDLLQMDEIKAVSEIAKIVVSPKSEENYRIGGGINTYEFLGINTTTFASTAFWKDNYARNSLNEIIDKLDTNTSIGIQSKQRLAMGLKIGDKFSLTVGNENSTNYKLTIAAEFDYFPNLVTYVPQKFEWGYDAYKAQILADINLVKAMNVNTGTITLGAYVKVNENANITAVKEELALRFENSTKISITSIDDKKIEFSESIETRLIMSTLQGMLIVTLLVSIIGVAYFSFVTLAERNREIGTFRAIGMVKHQIFFLLVIEGLILLFSGIIFGGIAGIFMSSNFIFMVTGNNFGGIVPPFKMSFPWRIIGNFSGLMIIMTILAAAIPAQITASKQTGSILRAE